MVMGERELFNAVNQKVNGAMSRNVIWIVEERAVSILNPRATLIKLSQPLTQLQPKVSHRKSKGWKFVKPLVFTVKQYRC